MTSRAPLFLAAMLVTSACASNPPSSPVVIDYRSVDPTTAARSAPAAQAPVAPYRPPAAAPSTMPAVQEAAALPPLSGARPGGSLRQPRDNPSARAISVSRGDSLYAISQKHSVNMRALIETNRLEPPYALEVGQVVYLPPPNIHVVQQGETLYSVSRRYNVDTRSLALLNQLQRPWTVWPGDELLLPPLARDQSRRTPPVAAPVSAPASNPRTPPLLPAASPLAEGQGLAAANRHAVNPASGNFRFLWPVSGPVLRGYGVGADGQRNDGVNIAVSRGAEVRAAAAGEVVYSGSELSGFGNLLLIRHPEGWVSAYGHLEGPLVREGDRVGQGAVIARAGQTGSVNRPQVHFELRRGRDPVDPTAHMPPLQDRAS
jgi:murein DD-endopeptidase MepM/ murein hydrolase activator NlpD